MSTLTIQPSADAFVSIDHPDTYYNTSNYLTLGSDVQFGQGMCDVWMYFNTAIVAGSLVNAASLVMLPYYEVTDYGDVLFDVYSTTDTFADEYITYNNAPYVDLIYRSSESSPIGGGVLTLSDAGIVAAVQDAVGYAGVIFALLPTAWTAYFADKDYPSAYPYLFVDYTPPSGRRRLWVT